MTDTFEIKPALTHEQMIALFKERGLIIENEVKALEVLKRVSYYRFTGYDLTFKRDNKYIEGTTFEKINRHYEFDKSLRFLLIELIEYIEISLRTQISYMLAHEYPELGYRDPRNFIDGTKHQEFLTIIDKELSKSKELFVKHHRVKRNGVFPVWVALEVATFSNLVGLYSNMKIKDKMKISKEYNIPHPIFLNWLTVLQFLRNRCAHHSRLFNSLIITKPKILYKDKKLDLKNDQLFMQVYLLKYFIKDLTMWNSWVGRLAALIEEYDEVDIGRMGFTETWRKLLTP